jgi:hypothetical protein
LMRLFSSISAARLASRAASLLVWVDDVVDMLISKLIFECQRLRLIQSANLDQKDILLRPNLGEEYQAIGCANTQEWSRELRNESAWGLTQLPTH